MSIYLYNLGISLQPPYPSQGSFYSPGTAGLNQSGMWFTLNPQLQQPNLQDTVYELAPLTPANWINPQPDTSAFSMSDGDFMLVRLFLSDTPAPTGCNLRLSLVFGKGSSAQVPSSTPTQSPLQMSTVSGSLPRAVVDTDGVTPSLPSASDNAWTFCLGKIYNGQNDYSVNVGATLVQGGQWYTFGHDPQIHIKGMGIAETAA